jgi:hypothetical protein
LKYLMILLLAGCADRPLERVGDADSLKEGTDDVGLGRDAGPEGDGGPEGDVGPNAAPERDADRDAAPDRDAGPERDAGPDPDAAPDAGPPAFALPPPNAAFDYQLGGPYAPPRGVTVVARDRTAAPAPGLYNICYINGFQVQPGEEDFWLTNHPDLLLRDRAGELVIDPDWDEILIDIRTPDQRRRVAQVVGGWIAQCAADGYHAVEIDNLDTFSRSGGLLQADQAVATMALFSAAAHQHGLAIAQKNSAEIVDRRAELGTDFVVTEECNVYDECDVYTGAYGEHVLVIEYQRAAFETGCRAFPQLSIILRDLDLTTPRDGEYVYDGC